MLHKLFSFLRLPEFFRYCNRTNVTILCYHGITERRDPDPDDRSGISMHREVFFSQLEYLMRFYRVISLREYLVARRKNERVPAHSVILTFDDGWRNFLTVAAPVLRQLNLPATVFLITDRVEQRGDSVLGSNWTLADDRNSLTWAEAICLRDSQTIEFGSHTCSHPELPLLSAADLNAELQDSFSAVAEKLNGAKPTSLAYPYGQYSETIAEKARTAGYACALTTAAGCNRPDADLFQLRRAVVHRDDSLEVFAARVSGLVGWLRLSANFFQRFFFPGKFTTGPLDSAVGQKPGN